MKKLIAILLVALPVISYGNAVEEDSISLMIDEYVQYMHFVDSVHQTFEFQKGTVTIGDELATIEVPEGFKYLDPEQSNRVLADLWGNPPSENLGMLFPDSIMPLSENFTYAIEISYAEEGYIDDEDAEDIDYSELLEEMQSDVKEENVERKKLGYPTYQLVGWAQEPYYDANTKKLFWAKEIKFDEEEGHTLNYNFRILGRKGYLVLNAIGNIEILPLVNDDSEKILASVSFNDGSRYADFDPELDKVAAYGIGGLVAGKILAKAGIFAILAKFGKFIIVGIVGIFAMLRKKIFGGGAKEEA